MLLEPNRATSEGIKVNTRILMLQKKKRPHSFLNVIVIVALSKSRNCCQHSFIQNSVKYQFEARRFTGLIADPKIVILCCVDLMTNVFIFAFAHHPLISIKMIFPTGLSAVKGYKAEKQSKCNAQGVFYTETRIREFIK
ncbi:hypothetical protein VNO77_42540 [Canavalia gladiata]|uniref:Uncharacterized protein n=1 Tax=Canavalia gladiata TaxID=3824 RepID=A0AAN9PM54_CANGL